MIFVAGGTGFLGSHLLYNLVQLGEPVRALYRDREKLESFKKFRKFYPAVKDQMLDNIEWVKGDILDYYTLSEYMSGVSMIYNVTGTVSFHKKDKQKLLAINARGTANIVNACLENKDSRLCHVSSISAMGDPQDGDLIDESRHWSKNTSPSPYSYSKFRGEMEVWRGINEGLNAVIVNPSIIIGPGMWYGSWEGIFRQVYKGLNYYPTGASGYIDVRDVVKIMISLMESGISGERFILNAENLAHHEVLNYLAEAMKKPLPARPLTPAIKKIACHLEKLRSLFTGSQPRITRQSMKSSTAVTSYSNDKIVQALSPSFIPVRETLTSSVGLFLDEQELISRS
jgi:nucleoside-diphosphate-sugar epimerase